MNFVEFVKTNRKPALGIALAIAGLSAGSLWSSKPIEIEGTINNLSWERSIDIMKKKTVKKSGWGVPSGARVTDTRWEYKGQKKVPSGIDENGNTAYKEISEYATRYYYEVDEWPVSRKVVTNAFSDAKGSIIEPYWGQYELEEDEKVGYTIEEYCIHIVERETGTLKSIRISDITWRQIKRGDYVRVKVGRFNRNVANSVEILN